MATYTKRKNFDGSFSHQFRIRRVGFPVITKTFDRKTDGDAWVQDTESAMRAGKYCDTRAAKEITVAQLIDTYISQTFHKRRSIRNPLHSLEWWKERIGTYPVAHIKKSLLKKFWIELANTPSEKTEKPLSNRSLNSYIETLSACFSYAIEEEIVEVNPVLKLKKKSLNNSRNRVLSEAELSRLIQAAKGSSNQYLYCALLVSLSTGGRRSEVLGLSWKDINLATGEVRFTETKNGEPRTVLLGRSAKEALVQHSKLRAINSDLVFPSLKPRRGGNTPPWEDLSSPFRRACKRAEITNFRWHDLRHSAASFLLMSGASLPEVMKILGHKSAAMSWRYAHLDQKRTSELVQQVDNNFLSIKVA